LNTTVLKFFHGIRAIGQRQLQLFCSCFSVFTYYLAINGCC
jgi:hypothetical protein